MEDVKWLKGKIEEAKEWVVRQEQHNFGRMFTSDSAKNELENYQFRLELTEKGIPYVSVPNHMLIIGNILFVYSTTGSYRMKGEKEWHKKGFWEKVEEIFSGKEGDLQSDYYKWAVAQKDKNHIDFVAFKAGYEAAQAKKTLTNHHSLCIKRASRQGETT
jgi:hypothetical protein